ncbi:MAG: hypothetical protein SPG71_02010 [Clostridia bacterium]|uniref:Uncharacterized protein n=1 Tax=Mogibacterium kristiansenii TaxID=2606708 RepID=A0A6N7X4L9_9FIRM|nr:MULTISPECIES: hypothetical protein [Mogibacterium]MDY5450155.1 hypothetical protein [Clostridia bacterium]MCI7123556.1 hypothetical protein [Mogibacterium sp.]MDD6700080.1 hypothetical protein [Mogibacterium kristiansenii]MEE0370242.1 hypothetical protein [Clostridia bacterium]MST70587.1 hypothetical protein [Mogibacterium kristiansenii]
MTLKKRNTAKMREIMTEQDIAAAKAIRRKKAAKLGMRIAGVSMLAGALLVVTTKKIFDEIFLEDDWSDVDWGEEDDDYIID